MALEKDGWFYVSKNYRFGLHRERVDRYFVVEYQHQLDDVQLVDVWGEIKTDRATLAEVQMWDALRRLREENKTTTQKGK